MHISSYKLPAYVKALLIALLLLSACKVETSTETPTPVKVTVIVEATRGDASAPASTATPYPTYTPYPTFTPEPTATPAPTDTPTPEATVEATAIPVPTETAAPEPTQSPTQAAEIEAEAPVAPVSAPNVVSSWALTLLEDNTPAPPLSIHVSANRLFEGYHHLVTGVIRNDGDKNYAGLGVVATFYMDTGRRYGPVKVNGQCLLIAPGEDCPFLIEVTSKDLVSVELHPEGYPTDRGAAPTTVGGVGSYRDAAGYVHITGYVSNPNPFAIKGITVNGVLRDGSGQIVSQGVTTLLETVEPQNSAAFDVMIKSAPYSIYQLFVQAEPK